MNESTATLLFERVHDTLSIAGYPQWPAIDEPGFVETLAYLENDPETNEPSWALVRHAADSSVPTPDQLDVDDLAPIDTTLATDLIRLHLSHWLADRGWQVQLSLHKQRRTWRLADCLSFTEGGGDRLDADYPFGDDELDVLLESVRVVAGNT